MKKIRKILGGLLIVSILFTAGLIYVDGITSQGGYYIKNYDIEIEVTDGNILRVNETIDAYFTSLRHGLYRIIPTSGTIDRIGRVDSKYMAMVYGINVSEKYTKETTFGEDSQITLKIGDASTYVSGDHRYIISYNYYLGEDNLKDFDELYFNIIGTDWDCNIEKVSFKITMPSEFDVEKLGFTHGRKGTINSDDITYDVDGTVIIGSIENLEPNEALTVRCELPQGYFKTIDIVNVVDVIIIGIIIALVTISAVRWYKYGKDKPVIPTVEFYPPEGLNSLELAQALKGKAEEKDVTSLLIYLANQGYLKIEEVDREELFKPKFKIVKVKEYDGNNSYEKTFFNGLFRKKDEVTTKDLIDKFYITQNRILSSINSKSNLNKIVNKKSQKNKKKTTWLLAIAIILTYLVFLINFEIPQLLLFIIPYIIGIIGPILLVVEGIKHRSWKVIILSPMLLILSYTFSSAIISTLGKYQFFFSVVDYITIGICIAGVIALTIFRIIMPSRTKYGIEILGKIEGFKNFLVNARKDELEQLVQEHPTYFYDILPYTYVLGISDKWISKFEEINISSPQWYSSYSDFSVRDFGDNVYRTYNSTSHAMSSRPSSSGSSGGGSFGGGSSGGSFSGGGSSGGGSGGGGGGSW